MPTPGQELATIDFASMLGGPLVAVVNAQAQAALSSVNFIKSVGFEPTTVDANKNPVPGKPIYVSFKYPKELAPFQPADKFVAAIALGPGGSGYSSPPTVAITGGGGTGASATAQLAPGGVTAVNVTNGGSGYTSAPVPSFSGGGGNGAAGTAVVANGVVTSVNITAAGTGYTSAPAVTFTGGAGAGAAGTATVGSAVSGITLVSGGTGYRTPPNVVITGDGTGATATATLGNKDPVPALIQEMKLEVPILVLMPIPFIRIEDTTIDFHAKINSVEYANTEENLGVNADLHVEQGWPGGSAKLNVAVSYQKKSSQGLSVDRTYSMDVHIHAVQEELPAGMDRVLGILERAMREQPMNSPPPVKA